MASAAVSFSRIGMRCGTSGCPCQVQPSGPGCAATGAAPGVRSGPSGRERRVDRAEVGGQADRPAQRLGIVGQEDHGAVLGGGHQLVEQVVALAGRPRRTGRRAPPGRRRRRPGRATASARSSSPMSSVGTTSRCVSSACWESSMSRRRLVELVVGLASAASARSTSAASVSRRFGSSVSGSSAGRGRSGGGSASEMRRRRRRASAMAELRPLDGTLGLDDRSLGVGEDRVVLLVRVVEGVGHGRDLRAELLGGRDALQAALVLRGPVDQLALEQLDPGRRPRRRRRWSPRPSPHPLGVLGGALVVLVEGDQLAVEALDLATARRSRASISASWSSSTPMAASRSRHADRVDAERWTARSPAAGCAAGGPMGWAWSSSATFVARVAARATSAASRRMRSRRSAAA